MKPLVIGATLLALTAPFLGGCPQSRKNDADNTLRAIYSSEWAWRQEQLPDDEDSQKAIQDHLPTVTPAAQETRLHYWENVLQRLNVLDQPRVHRAPPVPHARGLSQLDRPDARHTALLP
jgi:hypothetical protein